MGHTEPRCDASGVVRKGAMSDSGSNKPSARRGADPLQVAAETLAQEEAEQKGQTSGSTAPSSDAPTSHASRSDDRKAEHDDATTPRTQAVAGARTPRPRVRPLPTNVARSGQPLVRSPRPSDMPASGTKPAPISRRTSRPSAQIPVAKAQEPEKPEVKKADTQEHALKAAAEAQPTAPQQKSDEGFSLSDLRGPAQPGQAGGADPRAAGRPARLGPDGGRFRRRGWP